MLGLSSSDETLINNALGGSQRSWVKLVQRHEKVVYNHCLRMTRNSSDAMDLLQEVFLTVYRNLPSYRGQGQFKGWLLRITYTRTIDFMRTRMRSPQLLGDDVAEAEMLGYPAPESSNPDHTCQQYDQNDHIRQTLAALPPEQRIVVELKFFQHLTFEEISRQTHIPVNTLKSRLYAALQKLKIQLEDRHVM
jgi:RNA polymerase sigma-70 factor (ECF subfamily)